MAYSILNVDPLDLQPSRGVGIKVPFDGPTGLNITYTTKDAIKSNDRIVMLGHGTEQGLIGFQRFIIDSSLVYLLREKYKSQLGFLFLIGSFIKFAIFFIASFNTDLSSVSFVHSSFSFI